jgi:hypothetical protein
MARVVVLTGGPDHAHDFTATGPALADLVAADGHDVTLVGHPDAAAAVLDHADVLVVNALRWRMIGDKYDPWRDQWRYDTPAATRDAISGFVARGGGLVGSHTASICFDDWPEWGDVLGGAWSWDRSAHPTPAPVDVHVVADHPVVADVPTHVELVDEVYGDLDLRPGIAVLATARRDPDDHDQPVVWTHRYGSGRVVYDGFGHDVASLAHEHHRRLLQQAVRWVAGEG